MLDSVHLLASHPSSYGGALLTISFSFPFPVEFLGAMRKFTDRFRAHTLWGSGCAAEGMCQALGIQSKISKETMNGLKNRSILSIDESRNAYGD